jgi:hypothetical protein
MILGHPEFVYHKPNLHHHQGSGGAGGVRLLYELYTLAYPNYTAHSP